MVAHARAHPTVRATLDDFAVLLLPSFANLRLHLGPTRPPLSSLYWAAAELVPRLHPAQRPNPHHRQSAFPNHVHSIRLPSPHACQDHGLEIHEVTLARHSDNLGLLGSRQAMPRYIRRGRQGARSRGRANLALARASRILPSLSSRPSSKGSKHLSVLAILARQGVTGPAKKPNIFPVLSPTWACCREPLPEAQGKQSKAEDGPAVAGSLHSFTRPHIATQRYLRTQVKYPARSAKSPNIALGSSLLFLSPASPSTAHASVLNPLLPHLTSVEGPILPLSVRTPSQTHRG